MTEDAWFVDVDSDDTETAVSRIREGSADAPADWPAAAVESGFAADEDEYYERLRAASIEAARTAAAEAERADDKQLMHAVRAMDDAERTANELAERLGEWAGSLFEESSTGVDYARELAEREPQDLTEERVVSLAGRVAELADERDALREYVERRAPEVAPNMAEMAGPVLTARLVSLAGGLDSLAKKPSGTVQVLGAEDALFAHLAGRAPSPKHGVIYVHEAIRGTRPQDRGSAARALAGKLVIAARIDHYSGDMRPEIHDELRERIEAIRARAEEGDE
ncbi:NOP5/NOP56 family protein [Haloprofundus sp. MHR1]|uniref:NOP5/NOP56 family protein n=1 Tax=Haloprofundus sp. MHR1 TaxID=2572921 RepID=UPI0010BEF8AC|nr:NOP5/NOP56 family protein [Haloprofundus sp. MHR1]QCJ48409.1 NOP58 family protein [Haloprofundus sp. MHR1]